MFDVHVSVHGALKPLPVGESCSILVPHCSACCSVTLWRKRTGVLTQPAAPQLLSDWTRAPTSQENMAAPLDTVPSFTH